MTVENEPPSGDPLIAKDGPELVFAFVGPVGCHLHDVQRMLEDELKEYRYSSISLRLSDLVRDLKGYGTLPVADRVGEHDRISALMNAGTELRKTTGRGDIFSLLAIGKIREERLQSNVSAGVGRLGSEAGEKEAARSPLYRTAYILRSLKHPDEADTLRDVYGRAFFLISVYSPREVRLTTLTKRIKKHSWKMTSQKAADAAEGLLEKDENEEVTGGFGQRVRDTFHLADVFVDSRDSATAREQIRRFLKAVFDAPDLTPRKDEYCMNLAKSVSLRSGDLSRQVGAVIATTVGEVLAAGCNDVPKSGGGQYWVDDFDGLLNSEEADGRDYARGRDTATTFKHDLVTEFLKRLGKHGMLSTQSTHDFSELAGEMLWGEKKEILKDTLVASLIEHGRPVHAEMAALMDAAKRGTPTQGAVLFCTTFPCHLCAKHIVAAGISRVIYIEPYPKSLAKNLYDDSIQLDVPNGETKVLFQPFVGISPIFFSRAYRSTGRRKNKDGTRREWGPKEANPEFKRFVLSYMMIEEDVMDLLLAPKLKEHNLV